MNGVREAGFHRSEHTVTSHAGMANSPDLRWVSTVGPQSPASNSGTRDLVPEGAFLGWARLQGQWIEIHKEELWHWSKKQDKLNL